MTWSHALMTLTIMTVVLCVISGEFPMQIETIKQTWGDDIVDAMFKQMANMSFNELAGVVIGRMSDQEIEVWVSNILKREKSHE